MCVAKAHADLARFVELPVLLGELHITHLMSDHHPQKYFISLKLLIVKKSILELTRVVILEFYLFLIYLLVQPF